MITVFGSDFLPTDSVACQFGTVGTVTAVYVSSSVLVCVAPAASAGTIVSVGVSNDGITFATSAGVDFTWDGVFYSLLLFHV